MSPREQAARWSPAPPAASAPRPPGRWPPTAGPSRVNYRSGEQAAEQVVKEIADAGGRAIAVQGDVADPACADVIFGAAEEAFGGPSSCSSTMRA